MQTQQHLIEEINALVPRFKTHQANLRLKPHSFAARYREFLGSEKTWGKLLDGTFPGHVNLERCLGKLRAFAERLDGISAFDRASYIASLPFTSAMDREYERLLGSGRDRRCMIALAPEGVGKSWWASAKLAERDGVPVFYVRLNHTWREKSFHITRAIALRVGAPESKNPAGQMEALIATLKSMGELVIIIDEGHLGGVVVFRIIKDLIDEVPGARFVYIAFPTEFDSVRSRNTGAVAEAKQLFRRSLKPPFEDYRFGIGPKDIERFLRARGFSGGRELSDLAEQLTPVLQQNQNLSTLADAVDDAVGEADARDVEPDLPMLRRAVVSLCSTIIDRRRAVESKAEPKKEAA